MEPTLLYKLEKEQDYEIEYITTLNNITYHKAQKELYDSEGEYIGSNTYLIKNYNEIIDKEEYRE